MMAKPLLPLLLAALAGTTTKAQPPPYDNCLRDDYYASYGLTGDPTTWTRTALQQALRDSHRNVLLYTNLTESGVGDTIEAIRYLDQGLALTSDGRATVRMLYSEADIAASPIGVRTYLREHIFPTSRGVGLDGPDFSDLHNLRPVKSLVNLVRDDHYFGMCGILVRAETCTSPAEAAANGTCACNRLMEPSDADKGLVARALMYMDLRYDGRESDTLDLRLTDCPFQPERDMAYLSQMLTWHEQFPPDDREKARNDNVCSMYQGVRNPFVDFEGLARAIYGPPDALPEPGRLIYEKCENIPTESPTFSPNECESLSSGDVYIVLYNSLNPDSLLAFSFQELSEGFEIFLTDNAWDGNRYQENEGDGTIKITVPVGGWEVGTAFGYGDGLPFGSNWVSIQGDFSLSTQGEQIHMYCLNADGSQRPLAALTYSGEWLSPADKQPPLSNLESYLPVSLRTLGNIVLPTKANGVYNGPTEGSDDFLRQSVTTASNWLQSDESRYGPGVRETSAATRHQQQRRTVAAAAILAGLVAFMMA